MFLIFILSMALARAVAPAERLPSGCLRVAIPNATSDVKVKFESRAASKTIVMRVSTTVCLRAAAYDISANARNGAATATMLIYPGTSRHLTLLLDPKVTIDLASPAPAISSFSAPIAGLAVRAPDSGYTVSLIGRTTRLTGLGRSSKVWANETGVADDRTTFFDFLPPGEYVADIQGGNFEIKRRVDINARGGIRVIDITLADVARGGRVIWHKY